MSGVFILQGEDRLLEALPSAPLDSEAKRRELWNKLSAIPGVAN